MIKRTKQLYQEKCLSCGNDEFDFSVKLQVLHNMGKMKLTDVFGGETHTRDFMGNDVEPYQKYVGWNELKIPLLINDTNLCVNIECSKCNTPIKNEIQFYGLGETPSEPSIRVQTQIQTKYKPVK